ncbi:hypothetical protein ANN_15844 [Periplaneta americana]|uniref:Uncharacterized protein n=1 Tax=Periplaneta americana TaxID=6978 RepID=A0ABQ8SIC6_PERAM|nr:hypothetical protein ANN_15844 [Periplaneta americana]
MYFQLIYSVQKKGLPVPFKGKHDLCKEISKRAQEPEIQKRLKKAKIDPTCPLNKTKLCVPLGENMDVSKYKQQFAMFEGRYNGSFTLDCDCGKSCFKFDVEFGKNK